MLYTVAAVLGLLAGSNALMVGTAPACRSPALSMKLERVPGEGDPFADGIRQPVDGPRPDMGVARWHADTGYIENEDEPWHSTSRPRTAVLTKGTLDTTYTSALPFMAAEEGLMDALRQVDSEKAINEAVQECLKNGGRPGCPAIDTAEKMLKAAKKDGAVKKAPPAKGGANGKGWDDAGRTLAKVHDNSI